GLSSVVQAARLLPMQASRLHHGSLSDRMFPCGVTKMSRNVTSPLSFSVLLVVLLGLACPWTQAQEKPKESLRSPRATVRTLFTSITLAKSDPQMIERAAACLDLSGLPANQQTFGGLLATQLEAVLRARATATEFIPDKAKGDVYAFPDW